MIIRAFAITALITITMTGCATLEPTPIPTAVEQALQAAGDNRAELEQFRSHAARDQLAGVDFLLANMPLPDMRNLTADYLAEHVKYAYKTLDEFPWASDTPEDIFLNYILPYACVNERRDTWRKDFYGRFRKLVSGCKTRGEVAIMLNTNIYDIVDVHYSKQRPKADQSPYESIAAKKASCTGLSILLVTACRAVGVPARIVGTPMWVKGGGNHTWVEIWDNGWHSIGASESKALNDTWFTKPASQQIPGSRKHGIYAESFKKTGLLFPMVWTSAHYVHAIDVTTSYKARESVDQ